MLIILGYFFRGFDFIQLASISQFFSVINSGMAEDKTDKAETADGDVATTEAPIAVQGQSPSCGSRGQSPWKLCLFSILRDFWIALRLIIKL